MRMPFGGNYTQTQGWNDPRYRASYAKFGLMGHNGLDYSLMEGTRVLAPHGGKIIETYYDAGGYGNYVKIEDAFQGSVLAHLSKFSVKVGQTVIEGDEIGFSGNTGNSTAPHLHWGFFRLPRNRQNGFNGFIDQSDWINLKIPPNLDQTEELKKQLQITKDEASRLWSAVNKVKEAIGSL